MGMTSCDACCFMHRWKEGLALSQRHSGVAHDSQKNAQTQNVKHLKSKIAAIFLLYFRHSKGAASLPDVRKLAF